MFKLSVIVPVYNSEKYIEKCLDSILNQDLDNIEIIVINDGSTDNSMRILESYSNKHKDRVKVYSQKNSGQAVARNLGITKAHGEYIAFVDSDDYIDIHTYSMAYNYAKKNNLDIVCFSFYEIINGIKTKTRYYSGPNAGNNIKKYVLYETSPWNKIIKRKLVEKNNIKFLENHIYEDLALMPTLVKYTEKIGYIDECLYYYIIRKNSTMRQKKFNKRLYDIYDVMNYLYENLYDTLYKSELEFLFIEHLLHGASLRFLNYKEGKQELNTVSTIIKKKFPNWRNNIYYKQKKIKYKIICNLIFYNYPNLVKLLLHIK